ncbi:MAG: hypothetical protein WDN01_14265 [Rhizomicrobium sp.]
MPQPAPDRGLRRIVAELSGLHGDDVAAILAELGAAERQTVETLLRDFEGVLAGAAVPAPEAETTFDASRFSAWLTERLSRAGDMTPHARRTLVACAARVAPASFGHKAPRRAGRGRASTRVVS